MSHEVETMAYFAENINGKRFVPWHGLGVAVDHAMSSKEALELAGLDWNVVPKPIYTDDGIEINGYKANTRDTDNSILGIVSDRYKIVQNTDAFAFSDALLDNGAKYVTAGSLKHGKVVWLLAQLPSRYILDDKFDHYICLANTHDGSGAVRVCECPVRVVCNNTLNLALSKASRSWSTKHMGSISAKLEEAKRALALTNKYMESLAEEADVLANSDIKTEEIHKILDELFPISKDATDRQKANVQKAKTEIMACYLAPDIAKFIGTKYGFMNAVSDWCGHATPTRMTSEYQNNNWGRIIDGHPIFDKAYELVTASAK